MSMIKIAHIVNPVKVKKSSDLFGAQPITFETMRIAKEYAKNIADITLFSAQYSEDEDFIPHIFTKTENLERSILDLKKFRRKRKLPLLRDILDRLYTSSDADYFIYTNCDIGLMPYFYATLVKLIKNGYDAFVINRRTIPKVYRSVDDISLIYSEIGESHKGWDCFIFKKEFYPEFELGNVCVGIGGIGRVLIWNLVSVAKKFGEFKNSHVTFHIGNERIWRNEEYSDYTIHNRKEAQSVLEKIDEKFNTVKKINRLHYLGRFNLQKKENSQDEDNFYHQLNRYKFVFIVGLHRSGTTVLADCLKEHPAISGFSDTGFPKDEGQFLQSVFPIAKEFGGPGRFGFRKEMHLTEHSPLLTHDNKKKIFNEWSTYWDTKKQILLEKSPPNILKTRFLQALFPNTYFIVITRHPIATSLATQKWSKTGIKSLLKHWISCHHIFLQDKKYIKNLYMMKYENFVKKPDIFLETIYNFLGIQKQVRTTEVQEEVNTKYFKQWRRYMGGKNWFRKRLLTYEYRKVEKEMDKFDYSLYDLD